MRVIHSIACIAALGLAMLVVPALAMDVPVYHDDVVVGHELCPLDAAAPIQMLEALDVRCDRVGPPGTVAAVANDAVAPVNTVQVRDLRLGGGGALGDND